MEKDDTLKMVIKNCICYYSDHINKIEDLGLHNIVLDETLFEKNLMFHAKLWLVQYICVLCSITLMGLLEIMMELNT